jgi:hypothetical protein
MMNKCINKWDLFSYLGMPPLKRLSADSNYTQNGHFFSPLRMKEKKPQSKRNTVRCNEIAVYYYTIIDRGTK